ncbi:GNAT family N-acetyltransferase [Shewanella sp. D64]|uniref:GNAT family N-acetyltransferase n=1 Tax=unclassified Shewanella TaxID=196818 RepID=UPI0022BA27D1|nr:MULTISPECIES: GNAT family N-acetyltransferase [unclassified Shewanella]MEC4728138.1 GNAT family N-acetyltransferase [Shewanella sp. D64]MEC4740258.1 GNAT family N-acetyltransferase [Shewanella sp. E94]WBJ94425.1 GNAT family N-acetyltransferase [Shewanella sp. MTB7]
MEIRLAYLDDVEQLQRLECQNINDELGNESQASSFNGQVFDSKDLIHLIEKGWIVVAEDRQEIVAYVIAGPWSFFQTWPVYRHILKQLGQFSLKGVKLTQNNACQYGPIWIKQSYRGQGIFEQLVSTLKEHVSRQFPFMLTFIAEDNMASFSAHTNKASMQVLDFFTFDDRDYYLLALDNLGE